MSSAAELLEHMGLDAQRWAKAFCEINPSGPDESIMIAWFANAIMAGLDHGKGPINGDHAEWIMSRHDGH